MRYQKYTKGQKKVIQNWSQSKREGEREREGGGQKEERDERGKQADTCQRDRGGKVGYAASLVSA